MALTDNEARYIEGLSVELENEKLKNMQMQRNVGQSSIFSSENQENLIQYQLDLKEELERIEHLLKGQIVKRDEDGNEYWADADDDNLKPFNTYGVQLIMNVISFYLNRNTLLSNYSEDMINWKMKDLGDEMADLIFMKYEEMGMDTPEKKKLFGIIIREIIDTVHSAYLRALNGGERESLRTARHVSQSVNPMGYNMPNQNKSQQVKWYKPTTWGKL